MYSREEIEMMVIYLIDRYEKDEVSPNPYKNGAIDALESVLKSMKTDVKIKEIKDKYSIDLRGILLLPEHFSWLIEQATKVERLEKRLEDTVGFYNKKLIAKNNL